MKAPVLPKPPEIPDLAKSALDKACAAKKKLAHDLESAQIAAHVYLDDAQVAASNLALPPGCKRLKSFENKVSGFFGAAYQKADGTLVMAYRGTDEGKDWLANAAQGVGRQTEQYTEAMRIGDALKKAAAKHGKPLEIVGHSLGGSCSLTALRARWPST